MKKQRFSLNFILGVPLQSNILLNFSHFFQVFVLMQFDPGLEYKPAAVRAPPGGRAANTQGSGVGGGGSNKDDNS